MSDFIKKLTLSNGLVTSGVSGQLTSTDGSIAITDNTTTVDLKVASLPGGGSGSFNGASLGTDFTLSNSFQHVSSLDMTLGKAGFYLLWYQLWFEGTLNSGTGELCAYFENGTTSAMVPYSSCKWETTVAGTWAITMTGIPLIYQTLSDSVTIQLFASYQPGGTWATTTPILKGAASTN